MNIKPVLLAVPLILTAGSVMADDFLAGYYGSAKYLQIEQRAKGNEHQQPPGSWAVCQR